MHISLKRRVFLIEYQPIILATLILGWSIYYFFSTINLPDGGAKSVLFIKPLMILLVICYPFVLGRSIKIVPKPKNKDEMTIDRPEDMDRGFSDHRRIVFAAALIIYAITLNFFGYLIPTIIFISSLCFFLGVRKILILILLPILLPVLLLILFQLIIGVPMPVWPWNY